MDSVTIGPRAIGGVDFTVTPYGITPTPPALPDWWWIIPTIFVAGLGAYVLIKKT